jgi:hypothetical protein
MRLALLAVLAPASLAAQTLVSTAPQDRNGLLEEFTAVNCPICPQGHAIAGTLLAANADEFIVVGVHGGGLSVPNGNQPDFRTTWGTALWSHYAVNSQPLGIMNRTPYNGQLLLSRTQWSNALNATLATPAPVNIGAATQFDESTRTLTVNVEVYYTATGTGTADHLSVLLTESDIIGFQASGGANYAHQHVLRTYLSPLWGDALPTNSQGTFEQRTYTYTVPAGWNIANCRMVAYVGEYQGAIHNAVEVEANNSINGVPEVGATEGLLLHPQPATDVLLVTRSPASDTAVAEIRDLAGKLVLQLPNVAGGTVAVDVRTLASGTYILSMPGVAQRFVVAR